MNLFVVLRNRLREKAHHRDDDNDDDDGDNGDRFSLLVWSISQQYCCDLLRSIATIKIIRIYYYYWYRIYYYYHRHYYYR